MATPSAVETSGWGRQRLLFLLIIVAAVGVFLLAGIAYGLLATSMIHKYVPGAARPSPSISTGPGWRDDIARAPMLAVRAAAARGGIPSATPGPSMLVPPATQSGPAAVPTGYPHNALGAVGQLAAIDTTVIAGLSVDYTNTVYDQWALPGAPPASEWVMTGNVRAFLGAAAPATDPIVVATPVAGQVKGTDGADWVLACVLLRLDAVAAASASVAYGHCEPMQWHDQRWQLAPGARAATAPSTWPGTDLARAAGWRTWVPAGGQD